MPKQQKTASQKTSMPAKESDKMAPHVHVCQLKLPSKPDHAGFFTGSRLEFLAALHMFAIQLSLWGDSIGVVGSGSLRLASMIPTRLL